MRAGPPAVLVYRLLTYVVPILLGGQTHLYWRRNRAWRGSAPATSAELAPEASPA